MRKLALFAVLSLAACQSGIPELTEAEIAQIEAEVLEVVEANFEGWRQGDVDIIMATFHPTATSWVAGSVPRDFSRVTEWVTNFSTNYESWEGGWTETEVKVLSREAALFQGHYSCTTTRNDGRVLYWPGNASWTNLLERTEDGWKITMGANAAGAGRRLDQAFGIYDIVSFLGEDWPTSEGMSGTYELKAHGMSTLTMNIPGQPEEVTDVPYSLGDEMVEGCLSYRAADEEGREYTGTACDGVLTIEGPDGIGIMHKRG